MSVSGPLLRTRVRLVLAPRFRYRVRAVLSAGCRAPNTSWGGLRLSRFDWVFVFGDRLWDSV